MYETNETNETNEKKNIPFKCSFCNKKLGLIYFNCQCNGTFCNKHRYTHSHQCVLLNRKQQENKNRRRCNDRLEIFVTGKPPGQQGGQHILHQVQRTVQDAVAQHTQRDQRMPNPPGCNEQVGLLLLPDGPLPDHIIDDTPHQKAR